MSWSSSRPRVNNMPIALAFERSVYTSKSFVIALALCRGRITADEAAQASHVEVRSQIEIWGEVEDCEHPSFLIVDIALTLLAHDVDYQDIRRSIGSAACLLLKA